MKTLIEWLMAFDSEDRPVIIVSLLGFIMLGVLL